MIIPIDKDMVHTFNKREYSRSKRCEWTIYCPRNPQLKAFEKRVNSSMKAYLNRCKKLDEKIASEDNSRSFTSACKSYGNGSVAYLVVGNFGELNKGFKQFIAETA